MLLMYQHYVGLLFMQKRYVGHEYLFHVLSKTFRKTKHSHLIGSFIFTVQTTDSSSLTVQRCTTRLSPKLTKTIFLMSVATEAW